MTNEFIALLKASALLTFIGVTVLSFIASKYSSLFFIITESWTVATLLYLAMTVPLSKLVQFTEVKFKIPGLGLPIASSLPSAGVPPPAPPASKARPIHYGARPRQNPVYEYFRKRLIHRLDATSAAGTDD